MVIAGMLVVVSIQLVDRWTLQIMARLFKTGLAANRSMLLDLLVIIVVTTVAVSMNIVFAVVIGVAVTSLFFLFRMSKSVIRRSYRCDVVRSRKTREPRQAELLTTHGDKILVLELEGPLFFGTAENLAAHIESALQAQTAYLILDIKRVNEIDSTGAKIILQTHDRLTKDGKFLLLSAFEERPRLTNFLQNMSVLTAITRSRLFHDTDRATRLITFAPGTVFGELALLDQEPRSATVEADEDLVCYVLTHEKFVMLTQRDPTVAIKLLTNLSRELASRLRRTTRTVYQLAS